MRLSFIPFTCVLLLGCTDRPVSLTDSPDFALVDDGLYYAVDIDGPYRRVKVVKRIPARQQCAIITLQASGFEAGSLVEMIGFGVERVVMRYGTSDPDCATSIPEWESSSSGTIYWHDLDRAFGPCRLHVDVDLRPVPFIEDQPRPVGLPERERFFVDDIYVAGPICNP